MRTTVAGRIERNGAPTKHHSRCLRAALPLPKVAKAWRKSRPEPNERQYLQPLLKKDTLAREGLSLRKKDTLASEGQLKKDKLKKEGAAGVPPKKKTRERQFKSAKPQSDRR